MEIQKNKDHHILNSKSEYNRCALPRLTAKLGDTNLDKIEKKKREEKDKEKELIREIRTLKMRRSQRRRRLWRQRRQTQCSYLIKASLLTDRIANSATCLGPPLSLRLF